MDRVSDSMGVLNVPWADFLVPLIPLVLVIIVVAVVWMMRRSGRTVPRLAMIKGSAPAVAGLSLLKRRRQDKGLPAAEEDQERNPQEEALSLSPQEVKSEPMGDDGTLTDMQGLLRENVGLEEDELQETPEQGEQEEEPGGEGSEPSDSLLDIFKTETVESSEVDAFAELLEDVDVNDLLEEARALAKQLRGQ